MCEPVLGLTCILPLERRQILFHLGIADGDLAVDFALTKALHRQLVADVFAILRVCDVLVGEGLAEVLGRQLVLLRDALHRALDHCVVDFHAVFLGELQQRALGHQALENLLVEDVRARRLNVLLLELLKHDALGVVQIVLRDRLVVDHCHDAVDRHDA